MLRKFAATSALLLLLSACSASQIYAGNKSDGAFFAVPNGWSAISQKSLSAEEGKSKNQADLDRLALVTYQIAYTKGKKISAREVFELSATKDPVVFARFRDLYPEERAAISLNALRDIILPVTAYQNGSKANDRNFYLLDDQELIQKGGKGVNLLYSFDYNGVNETVNQTTFFSNDLNKIYLFVVRCSTTCYNKDEKIINKIVKSFTVRGVR